MARGPFRSTPFRLSLALVGLFTLVSLASFSVSYFVVRAEIERSIRATLVQEMVGFRAAPNPIALAALVDAQARSTDPGVKILSYTDIFGRHSGNGAIVRTSEGFDAVALAGSGDEVARTYFALTERLHGGYLTLAASGDARAALRRTFTTILLISLLPTVAIALGGGLLLAQRSARRLAAVEATLGALTSGDITARMPALPGQADDLTRIGGRIDYMAEAHQASAEALRQVSADIAHDLKTPIQRVAVLLEMAGGGGSETQALVEQASDEVRQISTTFQSLLQIAQMEGGGPRSGFGPVDLGALARDMADIYAPAAEEGGHSLALDITDAAVVDGDRALLAQVLANLIENALRHAGPAARVTLSVDGARVLVADHGPGVPLAERDKVLRRLYRREASRTTSGSGLGLSLVRVIADLHRAVLRLGDNAPGLLVELDFAPHDAGLS